MPLELRRHSDHLLLAEESFAQMPAGENEKSKQSYDVQAHAGISSTLYLHRATVMVFITA